MSTPWMTEQAWAEHQRRVRISKMKKGRVRSSTEGRAGGSVSRPVGVMASVTSGHGNCEPVSSLASSPTSQTFFVPGRLPGANDIMSRHRMVYARLKVLWGHTIAQHIRVAKLTPLAIAGSSLSGVKRTTDVTTTILSLRKSSCSMRYVTPRSLKTIGGSLCIR